VERKVGKMSEEVRNSDQRQSKGKGTAQPKCESQEVTMDKVEVEEVRRAAMEYYKIHVTHRGHLFNLMLVLIAAAVIGFAETVATCDTRPVALWISIVSALLVALFWAAGRRTLDKIDNCKKYLIVNDDNLCRLYSPTTTGKLRWFSDRNVKGAIYILLFVAFSVAAVWTWLSLQ